MDNNTINIPIGVKEMNVSHLPFLTLLNSQGNKQLSIGDMVKMNSAFTKIPESKLRRYTAKDNVNLFNSIAERFRDYTPEPIPLSLDYDGVQYNFITDFTRLPVDWYIDVSQTDIEKEPINIMSFCFIEDGMSYGEPDEHENVKNPQRVRNKIFKDNINLSLFLDVQGFFLQSWSEYQKSLTAPETKRKRKSTLKKWLNGNGKKVFSLLLTIIRFAGKRYRGGI